MKNKFLSLAIFVMTVFISTVNSIIPTQAATYGPYGTPTLIPGDSMVVKATKFNVGTFNGKFMFTGFNFTNYRINPQFITLNNSVTDTRNKVIYGPLSCELQTQAGGMLIYNCFMNIKNKKTNVYSFVLTANCNLPSKTACTKVQWRSL